MTINLDSLTRDLTELKLKHFEKACRNDLAALTPVERDRMTALMAGLDAQGVVGAEVGCHPKSSS